MICAALILRDKLVGILLRIHYILHKYLFLHLQYLLVFHLILHLLHLKWKIIIFFLVSLELPMGIVLNVVMLSLYRPPPLLIRFHRIIPKWWGTPLQWIQEWVSTSVYWQLPWNLHVIPPCSDNQEYVKFHLFHLSLSWDAKEWYKCLVFNSITTWDQLRKAILEWFCPNIRTQDRRKKITSFTQETDETLSDAWMRFKKMVNTCPHYQYSENNLNTFFYDGLDNHTRAWIQVLGDS